MSLCVHGELYIHIHALCFPTTCLFRPCILRLRFASWLFNLSYQNWTNFWIESKTSNYLVTLQTDNLLQNNIKLVEKMNAKYVILAWNYHAKTHKNWLTEPLFTVLTYFLTPKMCLFNKQVFHRLELKLSDWVRGGRFFFFFSLKTCTNQSLRAATYWLPILQSHHPSNLALPATFPLPPELSVKHL